MIATLRQRNFTLFWIGGLISAAGDWVLIIGLPIYVYLLTRSVLATSITLIAGILPMIVLSSVAGVFVDRWNRQRTLVVVNVLLAMGLLPLLLVRSADDVWIVYVVNFVETCLEQFLMPAQSALLPEIVGEEHLVPANSLSALSSNLARLGGPPLGGLVAALFGITGMVAADTVSFLVAALCISGMRIAATPATPRAMDGEAMSATAIKGGRVGAVMRIWREWAEGLRLIASRRLLRVLVVVLAFASLGEGFFGPLFPVFVYQELHGEALQIGELMSAQAVGGLLAGSLVGWVGQRVMARWVTGLGWIGFGIISLAICFAPALLPLAWMAVATSPLPIPIFWVEIGLFAAVGVPGIVGSTGTVSLLQARSPDAYRGRIFGAEGAIGGVMVLVGAVAEGTLPQQLGVVAVLSGQGISKIIAGLVMIVFLPVLAKVVIKDPQQFDNAEMPHHEAVLALPVEEAPTHRSE